MKRFWTSMAIIALTVWSTAAFAQAESTLDKCQKTTGREIGKYAAAVHKTVARCLNKISGERIRDAAGTAAGAASACASALRKIVNTEDTTKQLAANAKAKIEKACDPAVNPDLLHTSADVLGPGATVAGDSIQAGRTGIPCLGFGGDGVINTMQEWIDCQIEAGKRSALRLVHLDYPQGDFWLRDVRPSIVALGPDQKYVDAATALDKVRRWVDLGNGTAVDYVTGLIWEKKDNLSGIHDINGVYTWSTGTNNPDGTAFTTFLSTLNGGATGVGNCTSGDGMTQSGGFAGHCDWRLPTIAELQTILLAPFVCSTMPCIDQTIFGPTQADYYWSTTTSASLSSFAWQVYFNDGNATIEAKTVTLYVRAVRGGS